MHDLQGVEHPIAVYQVLQDSGAQSRLDVAAARGFTPTPLIGRESEIALLKERWARVQEGAGQVVLLSGEAGIGKSRLVQVLKEHVRRTPHLILECRCLPYAQNSAWQPILEWLPRLLQWSRDDTETTKQAKLERFLRDHQLPFEKMMPLLTSLLALPTSDLSYSRARTSLLEQRQQLLDALLAMLLALAHDEPLLLIVEDVHWIDPSTLELLDLVIDQGPTAAICTLLTCRPVFQPAWGMRAHFWPLALSRLPRSQAAFMVARVADGKHLPSEVVTQLVDKTDGVPLFIEEMTKAVLESDTRQEQDWGDPLPALTIPATLQDSLMARLDRLGTAKHLAQLGATIGREFSYRLLQAVTPVDEARLQRELDQLIAAELVYQRGVLPQATYLFKHALIQDAAYQSLLVETRQQYHQRILNALETQLPDDIATPPDLLAYHATEGGLTAPAIAYWRQAGDYAYQRGAYEEAVDHCRQGLALLQTLPEDAEHTQREFDLLLRLGPSLLVVYGAGQPEVERVHTRIYTLCQHIEGTPQRFSALRGVCYFYWVQAQLQRARELEEQLLALAQAHGESALLMEAHVHMGLVLTSLGEFLSALDHFERGLSHRDVARHHPLQAIPHPEMACLLYSGVVLLILGYPDRARTRIHEGLAVAQQLSSPLHLVWGEHIGATFYQLCREPRAAREWADAVSTHTGEHGLQFAADTAQFIQGWVMTQEGDREAGIEQMRQGIAVYRARNGDLSMPRWFSYLAEAHGRHGEVEAGLTALAEAQELIDRHGDRLFEAEIYRLKGELLVHVADEITGVEDGPEAWFLRALDVARQQEAKWLELRAAVSLCRLWQEAGRGAEARELLTQTYVWFTEGFDTVDLQLAKSLLDELTSSDHCNL